MVIEQIDQYAGHPPTLRPYALPAGNESRVALGKTVNGPMQGHARSQFRRQPGRQRPFDKIAQHTANSIGLCISGQQGMRKKINGTLRSFFNPKA